MNGYMSCYNVKGRDFLMENIEIELIYSRD